MDRSETPNDGIDFELFTGRVSGAAERPLYVTLQRRGLLTFNRAAFEALGRPESVELLYNRDRNVMGIRPADPKHSWAYKLRREERSGMFKISIAAFRKHYGLPEVTAAARYRAEQHDGMLAVDLNQRPTVTGRGSSADVAF